MNAKRNSNLNIKPVENKSDATEPERMVSVLLLKGYTPRNANVISTGGIPIRSIGQGQYEYETVPATLEKLPKGEEVELPAKEADFLIRKGVACIKDHATDGQLRQAGLMPMPDMENEEYV